MNCKLILVEGLPSSGKSTTARIAKSVLDEIGINNELFLEGDLNHPADYDSVAYYNQGKYKELIEDNSDYENLIKKITLKKKDGYFIHYKKQKKSLNNEFPDELYTKIAQNDIYDLPLNINKELLLSSWQDFKNQALLEDKVYIFECVFIQNPITVSIIRDNAAKPVGLKYVLDILDIIKELNPVLFYLKQDDIEKSFHKVIKERPKSWLRFFINYYNNNEFGKENKFNGLEGTMEGLKKINKIQLEIFKELEMEKYILNNSAYKKSDIKNEILDVFKTKVK